MYDLSKKKKKMIGNVRDAERYNPQGLLVVCAVITIIKPE